MKPFVLLALMACVLGTPAYAAKPCDELKGEIEARLQEHGVESYTLDIVAKDDDSKEGKVVGTCEGGTKKIVYKRN